MLRPPKLYRFLKSKPALLSLPFVVLLSACDDSENSSSSDDSSTRVGVVTAGGSNVEGLNYSSPAFSGRTLNDGKFYYKLGEDVTFAIGESELATIKGNNIVSTYSLMGTDDIHDRKSTNLARVMHSLDVDGIAGNGIQLSEMAEEAYPALSALNYDQPEDEFAASPELETIFQHTKTDSPLIQLADKDAVKERLFEEYKMHRTWFHEANLADKTLYYVAHPSSDAGEAYVQQLTFKDGMVTVSEGGQIMAESPFRVLENGQLAFDQTGELWTITNRNSLGSEDFHLNKVVVDASSKEQPVAPEISFQAENDVTPGKDSSGKAYSDYDRADLYTAFIGGQLDDYLYAAPTLYFLNISCLTDIKHPIGIGLLVSIQLGDVYTRSFPADPPFDAFTRLQRDTTVLSQFLLLPDTAKEGIIIDSDEAANYYSDQFKDFDIKDFAHDYLVNLSADLLKDRPSEFEETLIKDITNDQPASFQGYDLQVAPGEGLYQRLTYRFKNGVQTETYQVAKAQARYHYYDAPMIAVKVVSESDDHSEQVVAPGLFEYSKCYAGSLTDQSGPSYAGNVSGVRLYPSLEDARSAFWYQMVDHGLLK